MQSNASLLRIKPQDPHRGCKAKKGEKEGGSEKCLSGVSMTQSKI